MIVAKASEHPMTKIETYPYKGKPLKVVNTWISWLSKVGPSEGPEYGLRRFLMGPGGVIPIHNHLYYQTMYILSGRLIARAHDPKTDEVVDEKPMSAGDFIFIPTMEPHSLLNASDSEPTEFLCCIANVCEDDAV